MKIETIEEFKEELEHLRKLKEVNVLNKHQKGLLEMAEDVENLILFGVNRGLKEVNKTDIEEYDTDTVWVADINNRTNTTHILDHIDPSSVKIEYLKRKP